MSKTHVKSLNLLRRRILLREDIFAHIREREIYIHNRVQQRHWRFYYKSYFLFELVQGPELVRRVDTKFKDCRLFSFTEESKCTVLWVRLDSNRSPMFGWYSSWANLRCVSRLAYGWQESAYTVLIVHLVPILEYEKEILMMIQLRKCVSVPLEPPSMKESNFQSCSPGRGGTIVN